MTIKGNRNYTIRARDKYCPQHFLACLKECRAAEYLARHYSFMHPDVEFIISNQQKRGKIIRRFINGEEKLEKTSHHLLSTFKQETKQCSL